MHFCFGSAKQCGACVTPATIGIPLRFKIVHCKTSYPLPRYKLILFHWPGSRPVVVVGVAGIYSGLTRTDAVSVETFPARLIIQRKVDYIKLTSRKT